MKGLTYGLAVVLLLAVFSGLKAQEKMISTESLRERREEVRELRADSSFVKAREFAREYGIPERRISQSGRIFEIRRISPNGIPMYYSTTNMVAAKTISTNLVWQGGSSGLGLDGSGLVVGVWDGGSVRSTHRELTGRVRLMDAGADLVDHATHVAGTIAATGIDPNAHGMANGSIIESYNWTNDIAEMQSAAAAGLLVSNHSYGFIQGWNYNDEDSRWEWYGDPSISQTEDYVFGFYGEDARDWDEIAYDNPYYLIVKSAGNDRGEGPAPGADHYVWSGGGWKQSTVARDVDGGEDGFGSIGTQSTSKNILSVGAVQDLESGYTQSQEVQFTSFSVFGPTDDGRIKPEIMANGDGLYSTISGGDSSYGYSSGTSMSSPTVAGSLALLQQHARDVLGSFLRSSQLKALVLHSADDAGNPGPDYKYGWGLMNTARAATLIETVPDERFIYSTLQDGSSQEYIFFSSGDEQIRITIAWTDPAGKIPSVSLNPKDLILVNDLDISLTRQVDNYVHRPFVLDPVNPARTATRGDNFRDNVEQILVEAPMAGFYTLRIDHKGSLQAGSQDYALLVTGLEKDYVASGTNVLTENNGSVLLTSADAYPANMDVEWIIQPVNGMPVQLYFDHFNTEAGADILSIHDGSDSQAPLLAEFSGSLAIPDTLLVSSTGNMYLHFVSDGQGSGGGFLGRYCTVAPEGEFAVSGNTYPCALTESSYVALGQEGTYYHWASDEGWSIVENSITGIDLSIGEETGNLRLEPYNRCGASGERSLEIFPHRSVPELTSVSGDSFPCAGAASFLHTDSLPGVTYNWTLPANWAGSSTRDTLFYIPDPNPGAISVSAENACGAGNGITMEIQVQDIPARATIYTDKNPPCAQTVQDFYVDSVDGYTYIWSVQNDWNITGTDSGTTVTLEVGDSESFVIVTSYNSCGSKLSDRLFLTSPLPPQALITSREGTYGLPELEVSNMGDFESVQWYLDGKALPEPGGAANPLVVNLNGQYRAESVSREGCRNPGDQGSSVDVFRDQLAFRLYRMDESHVAIENTLEDPVEFRLYSVSGHVIFQGRADPGLNEMFFQDRGIYLFWFFGGNVDQKYKVLF